MMAGIRGIVKDGCGFTHVEVLLAIIIGGILFGISSQTLVQEAETYAFIANRKASMSDVRYGLNRVTYDLLRVESGDITDIADTSIDLTDSSGVATNYRLAENDGGLAVFRGDSGVLIDHVGTFDLIYFDGQGNTLSATAENISSIRRIKVSIETEPFGNEGSISLSTTITPRSFIGYSNYQ